MPNGRCHSTATVATASVFLQHFVAGVVVTATSISEYNDWAFWMACGAFTGLIVEPDLDQDYQAAPLGTIRQTGGDGMARVWQLYWTPYARLIPHRSWLSHAPIIGTVGRILYLAPIYAIPLLIWTYFFGFPTAPFIGWALGLAWVDLLHFVMDFLVPRKLFPQNPLHRR